MMQNKAKKERLQKESYQNHLTLNTIKKFLASRSLSPTPQINILYM